MSIFIKFSIILSTFCSCFSNKEIIWAVEVNQKKWGGLQNKWEVEGWKWNIKIVKGQLLLVKTRWG